MDFWRAVDILARRKWLILLSVVATTVLAFCATRLVGSKWVATVRLVAPQPSELTGSGPQQHSSTDRELAATQAQASVYAAMIKSRDVLEPTLRTLRNTPPPEDLLEAVKLEASGPRLYELSVTDSSPARAQVLANALAESFVEQNRKLSTREVGRAVKLLEEQANKTETDLTAIRQQYDAYRRRYQIPTSINDQLTPALTRLQSSRQRKEDVNERLVEAQARLRAVQAQFAKAPATVPVERATDTGPRVTQIETELARVETELTQLRVRYTDDKMEVKRAAAAQEALEARLREELSKQPKAVGSRPNPEREQLQRTMSSLTEQINGYQAQITALNTSTAKTMGEIERFGGAETPLAALVAQIGKLSLVQDSLNARLQNARMAFDAAERQNPVAIMDPVNEFNPPLNTSSGRTMKLILIATLCALLGTSGVVIALDAIDSRVKTVKEAEIALPAPILAAIPQAVGSMTTAMLPRAAELAPLSLHSEAYRFLCHHLLSARGRRISSLMVVAAKAEQGTTDTATNLGIALAQAGKRVVIVDANIRSPQVHQVFGLSNGFGLTDLLSRFEPDALDRALQPTPVTNLRIIAAGPASGNPWELFRSQNLMDLSHRLRDVADYVLYDTPSALAFTDALNIAPAVDAAFLCVRALEPLSGVEQRVVELLEQENVTVLGSVLSGVPAASMDSYRNYQHYYGAGGSAGLVTAGIANKQGNSATVHALVPGVTGDGRVNGNGHMNGNGYIIDTGHVNGNGYMNGRTTEFDQPDGDGPVV
jgi:polysaccharide biosynthesis transport protein